MDVVRRVDVFQLGFSWRSVVFGFFPPPVPLIALTEFAAIEPSSTTDRKQPSSVLIPPDDPPHHLYLGEPPDADTDPLQRCQAFGFSGNVVLRSALQTSHRSVETVYVNIAEQPDQVAWLMPPLDVAMSAADMHKLPNLVGIAELPFATALASSTGIGHEPKIGTCSSPSQFALDICSLFVHYHMRAFGDIAMDHIVTLDSRQEAALRATADKFIALHKGDAVKALKEMIVLNGYLQERLDAVETGRRARRRGR